MNDGAPECVEGSGGPQGQLARVGLQPVPGNP